MKLFVASDIHGSSYYCKKMMDAYREEKADKMLLLGDLLCHIHQEHLLREYDPQKVIDLLNEEANDILCVRGHCEENVDPKLLKFPVVAGFCVICIGNRAIYFSHGHMLASELKVPLQDGDIILQGHTHVPKFELINGVYHMNPGSIALPQENSYQGYMTIDENVFTWKDLDGNVVMKQVL